MGGSLEKLDSEKKNYSPPTEWRAGGGELVRHERLTLSRRGLVHRDESATLSPAKIAAFTSAVVATTSTAATSGFAREEPILSRFRRSGFIYGKSTII
jgi:hypothetical protein